ncbi:hypothetical protein ABEB36_002781 [Hypothenemus hampei]|uniref:Cathepsin propeptide inhibitor domain-containing protein n=1 Tax=Hypothenemus hampei TaxID=57062 RepID=A0ABD1F6Z7_HYPHA
MILKTFILLSLIAVIMAAPLLLLDPVDVEAEWAKWKTEHNKNYDTPEEEAKRFKIFEENIKKIAHHNKQYQDGEVTWTQGLNQFADLTSDEFGKTYLKGLKEKPELSGTS